MECSNGPHRRAAHSGKLRPASQTDSFIPIQLLVDGSNANSATVASITFALLRAPDPSTSTRKRCGCGLRRTPRVVQSELKSSHFIVPDCVAVVMMMICALLTSVTLVRERETGTLEQILQCPRSGRPNWSRANCCRTSSWRWPTSALVILFSMSSFTVPFRGSAAFSARPHRSPTSSAPVHRRFHLSAVRTQQVAMMAAMHFRPSSRVFLLSGFISDRLPAEGACRPSPLSSRQVLSRHHPPRDAEGHGTAPLIPPLLFMAGFGTAVMAASIRRFPDQPGGEAVRNILRSHPEGVSADPAGQTHDGHFVIAPLIQLLILGYAVSTEVRNIPMAVCDLDNSDGQPRTGQPVPAFPVFPRPHL